jgi:hypothetical protein
MGRPTKVPANYFFFSPIFNARAAAIVFGFEEKSG